MIGSHFDPLLAHCRRARSVTVIVMSLAMLFAPSGEVGGMIAVTARAATLAMWVRASLTGPSGIQ